jgi:hypothetical protein
LSDAEPSSPQPPAPDTQGGGKPEYDVGGLKAQIDHMRQQQAYQQQQQVDPLAAYLASIPGLTPHKFYYLHGYFSQNPQHLNQQHWSVLQAAHRIALDRGVKEDSPEYFQFLDALLHQQAAPPAAPPPMPPPMPEPRPQPTVHVDLESHDHELEMPMAQNVSAPVSRGDHGHSVEPEPTQSSIRLSAEQRDIAARSGISEVEYAKQLLRMQKMKRSGVLKD